MPRATIVHIFLNTVSNFQLADLQTVLHRGTAVWNISGCGCVTNMTQLQSSVYWCPFRNLSLCCICGYFLLSWQTFSFLGFGFRPSARCFLLLRRCRVRCSWFAFSTFLFHCLQFKWRSSYQRRFLRRPARLVVHFGNGRIILGVTRAVDGTHVFEESTSTDWLSAEWSRTLLKLT